MAGMCDFLATQQWSILWTRLVLHDVYVRTHMTFTAAVWAPSYLRVGHLATDDGPLGRLAAQYRRGLRTLLHLGPHTRSTILYIIACRWPLELLLAKATWRYYTRTATLGSTGTPPPIATLARWAASQLPGTYPI